MVFRDIAEYDRGVSAMKLEVRLRRKLRQMGHACNTERAYVGWYRDFIEFCRDDEKVDKQGIEAFLSHLANERNAADDAQRAALSAIKICTYKFWNSNLGDWVFLLRLKTKNCR